MRQRWNRHAQRVFRVGGQVLDAVVDQRHQRGELVGGVALACFEDGDDALAEEEWVCGRVSQGTPSRSGPPKPPAISVNLRFNGMWVSKTLPHKRCERGTVSADQIRTQIIGAAGEALITYKLLKHEIDSARMTTDAGVDLVMYVPGTKHAATVQVKATWGPVPAGGRGELTYGWVFNERCPADWLAVVDLSRDRAWLFTITEAKETAQQRPESGNWRIYWYADDAVVQGSPRRESDMTEYEIDRVLTAVAARGSTEPVE